MPESPLSRAASHVVTPEPAALSLRARAALKARRVAAAPAPTIAPQGAFAPRYDDGCFVRGQSALDAPARALMAMKGTLPIDPAVWDSPGRRARDVP